MPERSNPTLKNSLDPEQPQAQQQPTFDLFRRKANLRALPGGFVHVLTPLPASTSTSLAPVAAPARTARQAKVEPPPPKPNRTSSPSAILTTVSFSSILPPAFISPIPSLQALFGSCRLTLSFHSMGPVARMDLDCVPLAEEQPEPSWSETTTPGSDDIEKIVRQVDGRPTLPSKNLGSYPRYMRPAIRRRLNIEERVRRGNNTTKSFRITTLEMRRGTGGSDGSSTSNVTLVTSTGSSSTDRWSSSGFIEDEEEDDEGDVSWDGQDEDLLLVPKLEPLDDDDVDMNDVKNSGVSETPSTSTSPITIKRPRGRPRKHPKISPDFLVKAAKGRSKTGCITCRRRKKKCDEAKPGCMNCEKNSVTCEGYPQKTTWKSGKERAEEARLRRDSSVMLNIKLQPIIPGVETEGDKMFFEHYIFRLSGILTVETEKKHSFKDMLLQLAVKNVGLMHSILALSSKHIDFRSPYGIKFLREHPDVDIETLEERSQYHHDRAMSELTADIRQQTEGLGKKPSAGNPAMYGQMICLVLETLADPNPTGQHRVHLEAYSKLIVNHPPEDQDFLRFIQEFFQYHISADELICLPHGRARLGAVSDDWNLPTPIVQPESVRLLGVSDGLFLYMSKITNMRNKIRENIHNGIDPVVDYTSLYRAAEIDAGIREWTPSWPPGDSRDLAGLLYKQMMWIYLWRTVYPPRSTSWKPDARIVKTVDDGIELLSQFKPSDPSQTLILAPAFVIGCAAFEERQREPIRKAIGIVKDYMQYKNSDAALKVLEEVWRLMDAKDEESWDWQGIAHRMGMDFLAT